ncbi:MAG: TIM barrel protein [bacterium]|nr:TIM barrel protein [Acidimicrobiia bacterium]MCY4650811.1 TIM barrel protein [bacterium]
MRVGAGPVSFGVYGLAETGAEPSAEQLVAAMSSCGYDGAELPPTGYAGPPGAAGRLFEQYGLTPVGIYIPIHFADPTLRAADEVRMEDALQELERAPNGPRIAILADEGSDTLLHNPGRGDDLTHALDPEQFDQLCRAVNRMAADIRRRGLVASFHPHISTYVETPTEIRRLLEATDIGLTFDTGHIALGGGDVLECWEEWRGRINHVHLKDVHREVMARAKAEGRRDFDLWWAEMFPPLGAGDLQLEQFLALLSDTQYQGWAVVEQDRAPLHSRQQLQDAVAVQAANLRWVRRNTTPSSAAT